MTPRVLERKDFQRLLDALRDSGHRIVGPTLRDGAIVYGEIKSDTDLPVGWTDEQAGGEYRLARRKDATLFGYAVGPQSWKQFLFPPRLRLWKARRDGDAFHVLDEPSQEPPQAFLGARSCELHALAVQDKVFLAADPTYRARRERLFVVAVNCGRAAGTCFCASMKTGPRATAGFDLGLTEVLEDERHFFVVETGSARGGDLLASIPHREATSGEAAEILRAEERATRQMGLRMDTAHIKELLYRNYESPRWDRVAERCLACANCTMVCPTCFCSTVEEATELSGGHAERWRSWDSCFNAEFSYIHGGSVRSSIRSRYRQWMTHKLATWIDQFGTSGCVGCGRCVTWCPVGIDITEEVRGLRDSEVKRGDDR
jgi:formate hydrogenlyase subunit 6/NADH:ubiquinone oxidoreductase subunit I